MMNPVELNLQDIYIGDIWVLKQVVELQVGAEGVPLGLEGDGTTVGDFLLRVDACVGRRSLGKGPLWADGIKSRNLDTVWNIWSERVQGRG